LRSSGDYRNETDENNEDCAHIDLKFGQFTLAGEIEIGISEVFVLTISID